MKLWEEKNKGPYLRESIIGGNERKDSSRFFSNQIRILTVPVHILLLSSMPSSYQVQFCTNVTEVTHLEWPFSSPLPSKS